MIWTPPTVRRLVLLKACGFSISEISFFTGIRRTQVAGKLHRLGGRHDRSR